MPAPPTSPLPPWTSPSSPRSATPSTTTRLAALSALIVALAHGTIDATIAGYQPGSARETRLQRAATPRLLAADPAAFDIVEPRTSLLREGLDATPARRYFVNEDRALEALGRALPRQARGQQQPGVLWAALRRLETTEPIAGLGRLSSAGLRA